ncbi:MAG TPA: hypothetical protein PK076_03965 [Saprospiraceae bacterium]|nr:hypothetical protein [Saprospiraceae bacterium]HQW55253.1 hypothetical protein [Saprospiraceae bacterium]
MHNRIILIITLILGLNISTIGAQNQKVKFVGVNYPVPSGCEKVSDFEIACGPFEMSWLYVEKGTIESILFETIKKIQNSSRDFQYKAVRLMIDTVPASGFVTSFSIEGMKLFQLYAAGKIRGQNVLFQCMDVRPFWKYDDANALFKQLITILPDINKVRTEIDNTNPPIDSLIDPNQPTTRPNHE